MNFLNKLLILAYCIPTILIGQQITESESQQNSGDRLLKSTSDNKLTIGGYAQMDYNQPFSDSLKKAGELDVHRLVILFGYRFNNKLEFLTEIEMEHVKEVYVEQAFMRYKFNPKLNFKAGLILIPMGYINEFHEPVTFNGVERPNVDKLIVPTTWREMGMGFDGNFTSIGIKYQAYIVNGFKSYDDVGLLDASNGLRKGRQKGAESIINHPNLATKVNFYGVNRLSIGLATYQGKTQSTLVDGTNRNNSKLLARADSSVVGISMFGLDARYDIKGVFLRSQYILTNISNTSNYNVFSGNNLGSQQMGFYAEVAYNVFETIKTINTSLLVFVRYENYNTMSAVEAPLTSSDAFNIREIVTGFHWKIHDGVSLKADFQWSKNKSGEMSYTQMNAGVGIWF